LTFTTWKAASTATQSTSIRLSRAISSTSSIGGALKILQVTAIRTNLREPPSICCSELKVMWWTTCKHASFLFKCKLSWLLPRYMNVCTAGIINQSIHLLYHGYCSTLLEIERCRKATWNTATVQSEKYSFNCACASQFGCVNYIVCKYMSNDCPVYCVGF
jgi:hypothetical protein